MTYSRDRIAAHLQGDCDMQTCPLCELDALDSDTFECPGCHEDRTDSARCDHTEIHCPDCNAEGFCYLCVRERGEE